MKRLRELILFGLLVLLASGCGSKRSAPSESSDPKVGEYYAFNASAHGYKVLKVLDVQPDLIHVCYYNNIFKERPGKADMQSLYFAPYNSTVGAYVDGDKSQTRMGRKHVPLTKENWKHWNAELIDTGTVTADELAEYEIWKKGEKKVAPGLWTPNQ